ncbi:hypothetical protein Q8A73_017499 [Channa argus]|nr:hypothetical protein Q8A73_017499 [Channa argus]
MQFSFSYIAGVNNIVNGNTVHNGLRFEFRTTCLPLQPPLFLWSMTAEQNVAGGGLSGRARGDLATSSVELVWLVKQYQVPEMCYSSIDRPGEQRANPSSSLMPSPVAADATWRPQTLQPARRRRRVPARSQTPMSMSCTEKAFSAGRQAACRPLLSPFGGRV